MRVLARMLAWALALATVLVILEGGLRLIGQGPSDTPVAYDSLVGWSNRASAAGVLEGAEFEAHWRTDADGLRRTPRANVATPRSREVVLLGDSFVFGTAADEHDTIAARLQRAWDEAGRGLVAVNAGTLGWDTGQAVRTFEERLAARRPAAVVLFAYENDLYWNTRDDYVTRDGPRAKLRIDPAATASRPEQPVPRIAHLPWWKHTAIGTAVSSSIGSGHPPARIELGQNTFDAELCVLLPDSGGAELDAAIDEFTLAAFERLRVAAERAGSRVLVVTLPAAPLFEADWRATYERRGLAGLDWSCERPVARLLDLADRAGLPRLDATTALRAHRDEHPAERLYWRHDWHLTPVGNDVVARAVAAYLTERLDAPHVEPATAALHERSPWTGRLAFWLVATLVIAAVLRGQPRRGPFLADVFGAALMVAFVMTIALGGAALIGALPPSAGALVGGLVVLVVLAFVAYHLRDRFDTVAEVVGGFAWRGHWYLMPTLVVLIGLGSLLIVAASSPIVAPFVYTLF